METQNIIKPATIEEAFGLELKSVKTTSIIGKNRSGVQDLDIIDMSDVEVLPQGAFIIANTSDVTLNHLRNDCIIPVFSKDNERTISHQEFIDSACESFMNLFHNHTVSNPEIRVSHQIKGRIPEAIHKNVKELLDHEKTQYFERMAFIFKVPSINTVIGGNKLDLTFGGVRAYNQENLYNKKSMERFKFFIGFQNQVCMNLCVWSDGYVDDLRVTSVDELQGKIVQTIQNYDANKHIELMKELPNYSLTESQFAQLIGKTRLYQFLPKKDRFQLPSLLLNDGSISTIARDYYLDESFSRDENGNINLWNLYNLFTSANKSSYIDTFLDRSANALDFTKGLKNTLDGSSSHSWFLS